MNKYTYALGRRKTAVATMRLYAGKGVSTVNGKPIEEAYISEFTRADLIAPFKVADLAPAQYYFTAKVRGGGTSAQVEAIRFALARCIANSQEELRKPLKDAGLLTRDPRMVERKKTGRHKARKSEQYSKR